LVLPRKKAFVAVGLILKLEVEGIDLAAVLVLELQAQALGQEKTVALLKASLAVGKDKR